MTAVIPEVDFDIDFEKAIPCEVLTRNTNFETFAPCDKPAAWLMKISTECCSKVYSATTCNDHHDDIFSDPEGYEYCAKCNHYFKLAGAVIYSERL